MKNYLKTFTALVLGLGILAGCKKDENKNFFLGGTPPVLSASKTNVVLTKATEGEEAVRFTWTNPNYQFTTGVSSHDVQYALEIDINNQFNSPKKFVTTISKDLSKTFLVGELNNILGNRMELPLDVDVTVFVRVVASLRFESAINGIINSNFVTIRTKPFAPPPAVDPPSSDRLVIVGSATPGGWDNNASNPQVFTRISRTLYEITIQLNGGGSCLFLPVAGSWDDKYGWDGANNGNKPEGDKLRRGGGDIKVPAASGRYKITVNFQTGVFSITPA